MSKVGRCFQKQGERVASKKYLLTPSPKVVGQKMCSKDKFSLLFPQSQYVCVNFPFLKRKKKRYRYS